MVLTETGRSEVTCSLAKGADAHSERRAGPRVLSLPHEERAGIQVIDRILVW